MPDFKNRLDDFMVSGNLMIENAMADEEIGRMLSSFGYDQVKLKEGKSLHNEVSGLFFRQKKEYGEQLGATEDLYKAWNEAEKIYMKTLKIARIAFQNNVKAGVSMMLNGDRRTSFSGWLLQANTFYINLLNDNAFLGEIARFGYDEKKIRNEYAVITGVSQKDSARKKEMGEAHEATALRDKKIDELDKWLSEFKAVAKVALSDTPQKLEILGIMVKS